MADSKDDKKQDENVTCDNHPRRKAKVFTGGGAYEIRLCEECAPDGLE